jgi:ADP-ribosylglycohydrolase
MIMRAIMATATIVSAAKVQLNETEFRDRVYACWMGKNIGGTLGMPFEGNRQVNDITFYTDVKSGEPTANDDLDLQLLWLKAMEDHGGTVDARILGEYWLKHVPVDWNEYGVGKRNMQRGLLPPLSGHFQNEHWRRSNGAWIRSEIWACLAPGCPGLAARMAREDACVDHGAAEGTLAEIFTAAVESAAFIEHDRDKLIAIGLSMIPPECGVARAVRAAIEAKRAGKDWRAAREAVIATTEDTGWFQAPRNVAFTMIGWLYGGDDFGTSLCIAVNCGDDTDCTGATLGSILGIIHGTNGIPKKWIEPIGTQIKTVAIAGIEHPRDIGVLTDSTIAMTRKVLAQHNAPVALTTGPTDLSRAHQLVLADTAVAKALWALSPYDIVWNEKDVQVVLGYLADPVITAGQPRAMSATIRNRASSPRAFSVKVEGVPAGWKIIGLPSSPVTIKNEGTETFSFSILAARVGLDDTRMTLEVTGGSAPIRIPLVLCSSPQPLGDPLPELKFSLDMDGAAVVKQPYPVVTGGAFDGPVVKESPDPLVSYRWPNPKATDGLEIYLLKPKSVSADRAGSFDNLQSLVGNDPNVTVTGTGSIRLDFGLENAAWVEFDSLDCPGDVEMSISEFNEPGVNKTRKPVKHGNTYRLELNDELYEGVRFAWIKVKSLSSQWHIKGIRAVCQVKPTNYNGSFSCSDPMLTKIWYMSAYGVKASLCKDYFGAILMDRGDRMSWTGDAHPTQAAALVAFGNYDFIKQNIDNTSTQSNGIRSYSLYWVLSLLDYYNYTGDAETLDKYIGNACSKLDEAYKVFGTNPDLGYYGWDERLCAGFELWFKPCPEAQKAYEMLSIRVWEDFATVMGKYGRTDLRDKYNGYASAKMADLRKNNAWYSGFSLHSVADAVTTGLLSSAEQNALFEKYFTDRVNRLSISPFNQYFIIQAMAHMKKHDDALSTIRDLWGGMIKYGATTTFEDFRPSWNDIIGPNEALPNNQCGIISLCHPWGAGVVKWLNEEVLGIVSTSPGFTTYDVLPHLGRTLTSVSGKTPTPVGDICASFDVSSGVCKVSAPAGTIGRIGIPKVEKTIKRVSINGKLAWDGSWHSVSGIGAASQDSQFVYFTSVQPGDYNFKVSYKGTTPIYIEPKVQYVGQFVKYDTDTSGNWGGVYGKDGYVLCNFDGKGSAKKSLPSYVTSLDYFRAFPITKESLPDSTTWATGTSDKRALSPDSKNSTPRNAACYSTNEHTMTFTIGIDGTRDYQIALYFVDWDKKNLRQVVEMFDANTLNMIAPVKMVDDFSGGKYLVYSYDKSVKFRIDRIQGDIATLSGIFFDPKGNP